MALEVQATNQVEVSQPTVVQTDKARIRGVFFDFDNTNALASVAFGTGDPFEEKARELWALSGTYYETEISTPPNGSTAAEVLLTAVAGVVAKIQSTPGLKDQLVESGELKIIQGSITDIIK